MPTIPEILLGCDAAERDTLLRSLPEDRVWALASNFGEWGHGGQLAPAACEDGAEWRTWVLMAGRGFGKTRAGAEWVLSLVRMGMSGESPLRPAFGGPPPPEGEELGSRVRRVPLHHASHGPPPPVGEDLRIALVAATVDEARRVMVEGQSGLLACARAGEILEWRRSRGELVFASGAVATLYSGANPEALRGPQHHFAWCDELAKWRHPQETWDMLQLGLRCGDLPRALVTTTPRGGCGTLERILEARGTVETGGTSRDNPHLPGAFLEAIEDAYGGTRMGREEIEGEFLRDVAGSLWPAALIEGSRGVPTVPLHHPADGSAVASPRLRLPRPGEEYKRVVIGVDPPASAQGTCGIVVCALGADGVGYVLGDHSAGGLSPEGWARRVAAAAEAHGADRVVAEANQGGEMVRSVLRAAGITLPVTMASASRSKSARAEPVAGLFECGKARLAGRFPELEAELGGMVPGKDYAGPGKSPDRADAMVWALWALMIAPGAEARVRAL